jgi:hypothetical protein
MVEWSSAPAASDTKVDSSPAIVLLSLQDEFDVPHPVLLRLYAVLRTGGGRLILKQS